VCDQICFSTCWKVPILSWHNQTHECGSVHTIIKVSLSFNCHFFPGGPLPECLHSEFIGAKDGGSGGDCWSYNTCKTLVKLSHQHPTYFTGRMPFLSPNQQFKALKGNAVIKGSLSMYYWHWELMYKGVMPLPFRSRSRCSKGDAQCVFLLAGDRNVIQPVKLATPKPLMSRGRPASPGLPGKYPLK